MRRILSVVFLLSVLLSACKGDKPFKIMGELTDGTNTNLYVKYYGNNALNTLITAARDGKFEAKGIAAEPTVARILDKDNRLLALVYVKSGEEIGLTIDPTSLASTKVTGNEVNDALTAFFGANAKVIDSGDNRSKNKIIAEYVKTHPADPASAVLLGFVYDASLDPSETASLVDALAPEAQLPFVIGQLSVQTRQFASAGALGKVADFRYLKAGSDSAQTFRAADKAASLIAFSDDRSERADSMVPQLKDIYKASGSDKLQIMDILIVNDTTAMKGLTRRDSVKWTQAWTPGGLLSDQLSPLGVPALPYYIVTDATGSQVYRGRSVAEAGKAVEKLTR